MTTPSDPDLDEAASDLDDSTASAPGYERRPEVGVAIGLYILAVLFGVAAWVLVVFGAWPGALLIVVSAFLGSVATRKINKGDHPVPH
jgi:hypothetical protein